MAYASFEQAASGYALAGAAALVAVAKGVIARAELAFTGVAETPFLAPATKPLIGTKGDPDAIGRVAEAAMAGVEANDDIHAGREYRLHLARVAKALTCSFDEHADHVTFPCDLASLAKRLAVALAPSNGEGPCPREHLAHERHRNELRLGHVVDRARTKRAEERRVDRGQMVGGDDTSARHRHPLEPVPVRRGEPERHGSCEVPRVRPEDLRILMPELRNPELREEHRGEFIATVAARMELALPSYRGS